MSQVPPHSQPANDAREIALELDKWREIIESVNDAVVTINQNHEVIYMNRAAEEMFGYQRSEILGGDLSPLIPHEHRENHRHYVERFLKTRQPRLIGHVAQVEAEHRDGTRLPISISFSVAEAQGELFFTAVMRDRSTEQTLAEQVKRAEHLAAVGETVATVSHEIKTPLMLIGGFARQLLGETELSPNGRHKLNIISEEVARLETLLVELNDFARQRQYDWQEVDVNEVLEHLQELMSSQLKKEKIGLRVLPGRGLAKVMGDRNRLSQVLINLVTNAAQASRAGDEVMVEAAADTDGVLVRVRDKGCGIPPEKQKQVFKPFFTTKPHGTGLGLAVARRIVEEHGGRIQLESQPEKGTVVSVSLPAAAPGGEPPRPLPQARP